MANRRNRRGPIHRKRGRWCIDYLGADGKRHRELVGTNKALAKDILAKKLAEAAESRYFPARAANMKSFRVVAEKYWDLHGKGLLGKGYKQKHDYFVAKFGDTRIGQICTADIQEIYNEIATRESSGAVSTANRYLAALSSVFGRAAIWGDYHGDNPCRAVKKLRVDNKRLRFLSEAEIKRLVQVAHPRLYPVLVCALMTGMRRGEILNLTWSNVDLERRVIHVLKSKSGRPRQIPIAPQLFLLLQRLGKGENDSVFQLPEIMLRRYFEEAREAADLKAFRFHDLRHTFASYFVMKTNDLPTLQYLMGHSTMDMTLRYAHLSRGHIQSGMAAFDSTIAIPGRPELPALMGNVERCMMSDDTSARSNSAKRAKS